MVAIMWIFQSTSPGRVDKWFRRLQLVSAAAYSLGHGGNDAQKTMGIIAGALVAGGYLDLVNGALPIPLWVILAAHAAIALGTLSGGWRIIHTMGSKITKLQPVGGFAAETAGAISLFTATHLGIPVSTTHTITGAIIGVGSIKRLSAVRWGVAGRIVWAWILTIPAAARSSRRSPIGSSRRRLRRKSGCGLGTRGLEARAATSSAADASTRGQP